MTVILMVDFCYAKNVIIAYLTMHAFHSSAYAFGRSHISYEDAPTYSETSVIASQARSGSSRPAGVTSSASSCDGIEEGTVKDSTGTFVQDLTQKGNSLEGVPPAYQGYRKQNFGSCSMAGSITTLAAYLKVKKTHPLPSGMSRFDLGQVHEWHTSNFGRSSGGYDEAVEKNFDTCYNQMKISADSISMSNCLSDLVKRAQCASEKQVSLTSLSNPTALVNSSSQSGCALGPAGPCSSPSVLKAGSDLEARRSFVANLFSKPKAQILPITMAWDVGVAEGRLYHRLNHVSNIIGRRLRPNGVCEILVRNSYSSTCLNNIDYPDGICNAPGSTDDFWVNEDKLMKNSGDFSTLQ